ncbi:hypothetical protein [Frigoribacterium sp. PvP032]|uniref:hypothetical protein n=1 Tax=Frigoribacterium sp. PvP032 TaxID=2806589 RepID=UPI001AE3D7C6|nr:hypothetical protein [Frigoribacterium sp. PvP032]MBP1191067.1 hypothetical protein [Frigoribacterium sp. PvP032]
MESPPLLPPSAPRRRRRRVARSVAVLGGLVGVTAAILLVSVPWAGQGPIVAAWALAVTVPTAGVIGAVAAVTTVLPSGEPSEHEAVDVALLVVDVAIVVLLLPAVWLVGVLLGGP